MKRRPTNPRKPPPPTLSFSCDRSAGGDDLGFPQATPTQRKRWRAVPVQMDWVDMLKN